jgi:hypothetical protein
VAHRDLDLGQTMDHPVRKWRRIAGRLAEDQGVARRNLDLGQTMDHPAHKRRRIAARLAEANHSVARMAIRPDRKGVAQADRSQMSEAGGHAAGTDTLALWTLLVNLRASQSEQGATRLFSAPARFCSSVSCAADAALAHRANRAMSQRWLYSAPHTFSYSAAPRRRPWLSWSVRAASAARTDKCARSRRL